MAFSARHASAACLLLLPLAAQCASVTLGANQYATASLAYLSGGGCFQASLSADSVSGLLFANVNTATQLTKAGLAAPDPSAEALSFGAAANFSNAIAGPGAASAYLSGNTAFAQPPEIVNSRWTTGVACQVDGVNATSCYGYFNDDFASADDPNTALTLIYAAAPGAAALQVSVDVWQCGDGAKQTGGIAPWQSALPIGQQFMPEEEACYAVYYAQLGAADVPVSPDKATCAACGKLGVCPVRASLYNAFYLGFKPPDSLTVRCAARTASMHASNRQQY